jgi:hypothetical protein
MEPYQLAKFTPGQRMRWRELDTKRPDELSELEMTEFMLLTVILGDAEMVGSPLWRLTEQGNRRAEEIIREIAGQS